MTVVLTFGLSATAHAQRPTPTPLVFGAHVESVFIDVSVTARGRNVAGLTANDFVLKDDGVRKPFDVVSTDAQTVKAVLVFDTSQSMRGQKIERLRGAADLFVSGLRPLDEASLVTFSDEVGTSGAMSPDLGPVQIGLMRLRARGATALYDALFSAMVLPRTSSRLLIIVFSDGDDNASWLDGARIQRFAERSNALIHVVAAKEAPLVSQSSFGNVTASRPEYMRVLQKVAEATGGTMIEIDAPEQVLPAFAAIVDSIKNRYLIRYDPDADAAPGWHKLSIELKAKKGDVRARTGYMIQSLADPRDERPDRR